MNPKKKTLLFVCTGNVCRSPMAEVLFNDALSPDSPWTAESAGLMATSGQRASREAVKAVRELNIPLGTHRSRPVTREIIDGAFCIVVMTSAHASLFGTLFPDARDRVHLLRSFDPDTTIKDVDDPIGMSLSVYKRTRDTIRAAMPGLLQYLDDSDTHG